MYQLHKEGGNEYGKINGLAELDELRRVRFSGDGNIDYSGTIRGYRLANRKRG
jgi:hypothetical protein